MCGFSLGRSGRLLRASASALRAFFSAAFHLPESTMPRRRGVHGGMHGGVDQVWIRGVCGRGVVVGVEVCTGVGV